MNGSERWKTANSSSSNGEHYEDFFARSELSTSATTVLVVVTVVFILLGVFGNALIIVSVVVDKKLRNRSNVFVVTLALADLVIQGYILPFTLADFVQGHYPVGITLCKVNAFIVCFCYGVSLWSLAFISINRYVKICRPVSYAAWFSTRNTKVAVLVLLMLAVSFNLSPYFGFGAYGYDGFLHACFFLRSSGRAYAVVAMLFYVVTPGSILLVCYCKIFQRVRSAGKALHQQSRTGQSSDTAPKRFGQRNISAVNSLFVVFLSLGCFMTPMVISTAFDVDGNWDKRVHVACVYMAFANSWINWIIYGVMNVNFRKTYKRLLLKRSLTENSVTTAG